MQKIKQNSSGIDKEVNVGYDTPPEKRQNCATANYYNAEGNKAFGEESSPSNHGSSVDWTIQPQQNHRNGTHQHQTPYNGGGSSDDTQNQVSVLEDESNSRERKKAKLMDRPRNGVLCPRCCSDNTKFCYFNNRDEKQPRYYCRKCQRFWTQGGNLRNVPPGSGRRKNKKHKTESEGMEGQQGVGSLNQSAQSNVHAQMNLQDNGGGGNGGPLSQFPHPAVVAPLLFNPLLAAHLSAQQMLQLPQFAAAAVSAAATQNNMYPQQNVAFPLSVQASLQSLLAAGNSCNSNTGIDRRQEELAEGFVPYQQQQNICNNNNNGNAGKGDQSGESGGGGGGAGSGAAPAAAGSGPTGFGDMPAAFQLILNAQLQQLQMQQQLMPQLLMQQQCNRNNITSNQQLENVLNCNNAVGMQWQSPLNGLDPSLMQAPQQLKQQNMGLSGQSGAQQNTISQQTGDKGSSGSHQQCNTSMYLPVVQSFWHPSCSSAKLTW